MTSGWPAAGSSARTRASWSRSGRRRVARFPWPVEPTQWESAGVDDRDAPFGEDRRGEHQAHRSRDAPDERLRGERRSARLLELPDPARGSAVAPPCPLVLDDVTFGYSAAPPVLHHVTLHIAPGEHLAPVEPSGAGKSTVAAGLLAPDSGHVLLGGVDLASWDPAALRQRVVALPQERDVLAENLCLVPGEHTDADLVDAVVAAGLRTWLDRLPHGLHTVLHGRGTNLSAGERQLVALARAALADPEILILDEATADVDPATDALIARALTRLGAGRTVVVAHRSTTAARHRRIVHLEGGRIVDGP